MQQSEIEQHTRRMFPEWDTPSMTFTLVEKGGSGRVFVRVEKEVGGDSMIAMFFTNDRPDNARFATITDFLLTQQIAAPRIIERQEDLGLLWVEDLGEEDLTNVATSSWETIRRPRYESALKTVFRVHRIRESSPPANLPELEPGFDEALYLWEQGYFFEHFVKNFAPVAAMEIQALPVLKAVAQELAREPRSLLHRDFQSTNVMLKNGESYLIDYQGLRWGLPEYDVASLIYDPYCDFSLDQQERLALFYHGLKTSAGDTESVEAYQSRLAHCGLQRLMQALGAYGFLGLVKGKKEFLDHIPIAVARLKQIAVVQGYLPELEGCLEVI